MEWLLDPTIWVGLLTLVVLEIVLGIDNLIFVAILTNRLPAHQQALGQRTRLDLERLGHQRAQLRRVRPVGDDQVFPVDEPIGAHREGGAGERHGEGAGAPGSRIVDALP